MIARGAAGLGVMHSEEESGQVRGREGEGVYVECARDRS
jgi:hypothetical protein